MASRKRIRAVAHIRALLYFVLAAEPEDLGLGTAGQSHAGGIVGIEYREVIGLLILKDARLGVGVGLEGAVAVEVVRRDVQHHGNFRTKRLDRLQLEARHLEHHDGVRLRGPDQRDGRRADIATDGGREAACRR